MNDYAVDTQPSRAPCRDLDPGLDFDGRIADLADKQARFSGLIDRWWDELSAGQLASILTIHSRIGVRLGGFLRERRVLGSRGEPPICIDEVVADLNDKLGRLSRTIDERWPELDSENIKLWSRLVTAYSQNCVRLERLMQARRGLREESSSDEFRAAMNTALDALSEEWGIEL